MKKIDDIDLLAFTLYFCPVDQVSMVVNTQLKKWWKDGFYKTSSNRDLEPLQIEKQYNPDNIIVALFSIGDEADITLMETNLEDGYASLSNMVSEKLKEVIAIRIRSKPYTTKNRIVIEEFDLIKGGTSERVRHLWVGTDDSGKWHFGSVGEFQSFENINIYKERRIRERFTREHILEYLHTLGVDLRKINLSRKIFPSTLYKRKKINNETKKHKGTQ